MGVLLALFSGQAIADLDLLIVNDHGNLSIELGGGGVSTGGLAARFELLAGEVFTAADTQLTFNTFGVFGELHNVTAGESTFVTSIGIFSPSIDDPDAGKIIVNTQSQIAFNPGDVYEFVGGTALITAHPFAGIFNEGVFELPSTQLGLGAATITIDDPCSCRADLSGDCQVNFVDVVMFLGFFSVGDSAADWNEDLSFDFTDVIGFLTDFQTCGS